MPDTSRTHRRRRQWLVAAMAMAVVALPALWQYRPLNSTERSLVGIWSLGNDVQMTFTEQRRFVEPMFVTFSSESGDHRYPLPGLDSEGRWSASGGELTMQYELDPPVGPWPKRAIESALRWIRPARKVVQPLRFDDPDHAWIGETGMTRIRD